MDTILALWLLNFIWGVTYDGCRSVAPSEWTIRDEFNFKISFSSHSFGGPNIKMDGLLSCCLLFAFSTQIYKINHNFRSNARLRIRLKHESRISVNNSMKQIYLDWIRIVTQWKNFCPNHKKPNAGNTKISVSVTWCVCDAKLCAR